VPGDGATLSASAPVVSWQDYDQTAKDLGLSGSPLPAPWSWVVVAIAQPGDLNACSIFQDIVWALDPSVSSVNLISPPVGATDVIALQSDPDDGGPTPPACTSDKAMAPGKWLWSVQAIACASDDAACLKTWYSHPLASPLKAPLVLVK
jgi:hypothetical protein